MSSGTDAAGSAAEWCGHTGHYETVAIMCGRRGQSDRLVRCTECDTRYLGSDLRDVLAHERARQQGKDGSMSVPISEPGNKDAATVADESNQRTETVGEGHIMGNLVEAPEMRFTPSGRPVANCRIAYTPRIKADSGDGWIDGPTEFYSVIVWGQQGERAVEHLSRGDRVVVAGTWTKRTWTDKEGKLRETMELTARDIGASLLFTGVTVHKRQRGNGGSSRQEG